MDDSFGVISHARFLLASIHFIRKDPTNIPFIHAAPFHMKLKIYNWSAVILKRMERMVIMKNSAALRRVNSRI